MLKLLRNSEYRSRCPVVTAPFCQVSETFGTDFLVHKILERCNAWVLTVSTSVMNGVFPLTCLEWNVISGLV